MLAQDEWMAAYDPHVYAEMPYRLMSPVEFDANRAYPVIVSLHGAGGRGTDNLKQLRGWNRLLADDARRVEYPCYVVVPQTEALWDLDDLNRIKAIIATLPSVDSNRIYVMGHSMGGHGSYVFIQLDPQYFAAAVPSAGTGLPSTERFIEPNLIKDIPIWAFHGDKDPTCPYEKGQALFAEMVKVGGNMKFTTWAGDKHGGPVAEKMITGSDNGSTQLSGPHCDPEPEFLRWLFAQSRSK